METAEICKLTQAAVARLLEERAGLKLASREKRRTPRWPFPGTVELWIPDEDGTERYALATSLDLSINGAGIRADEPLEPGLELPVAFHEPEVSFHGRAIVRHCTRVEEDYVIGLQFVFDKT